MTMSNSALPSSAEIARKIAQDLADGEARVKAAVEGVNAARAFAAYALSRLCHDGTDQGTHHSRPTPAAVELAAWLLYPNFGASITPVDDRMDEVVDCDQPR
jgi:hypothetical protein